VVSANILASTVKLETYGQVFNVGTGTNFSVNELAKMISDNTIMIEPRLGEARFTRANNKKIKKYLGWEPKVKLEDWISNELKGLK
jgi:nucleoside-diphosphate-sugar epimerase